MSGDDTNDDAPGFDESLEKLETIVAELEHGGTPLEKSLARYREGVQLLEHCRGRLASFRKQVEELSKSGEAQPYDGDPDLADESAPA